jgi:hypothetical protein
VLLDGFDDTRDEENDTLKQKYIESQENPFDPTETVKKSLGCLTLDNPVRDRAFRITRHHNFDTAIMTLIFISSICLAMDSPLNDPDGTLAKFLAVMDIVMTIIFVIEAGLKIVAEGFCFGKTSYLKHPENGPWNQLDFFIVVTSLASLIFKAQMEKFTALRGIRTLRTLRPLRMISRNPGMKQVVNALIQAMPAATNAMVLLFLFFLIFGILAVSFFKGTFMSCQLDGETITMGTVGSESAGPWHSNISEAILYPVAFAEMAAKYGCSAANTAAAAAANTTTPLEGSYEYTSCAQWGASGNYSIDNSLTPPKITSEAVCNWVASNNAAGTVAWDTNPDLAGKYQNFDNIGAAMLVLFEMSTTEGWVNVNFAAVDSRGIGMQPIQDHNRAWFLLGMVFILIGAFFMLNLFVGVVIDTFTRLKNLSDGSILQTEQQKNWVKVKNMMARVRAHTKKRAPRPKNPIGTICWLLSSESDVENPPTALLFDAFIMFVIIANTILMAAASFGQSDKVADDLEIANITCAVIFTCEAIIKILGLGKRYFWNNWDRFDFTVVVMTNVGLMLKYAFAVQVGPAAAAVRAVRIIRVLRLVNKMKTLKMLFSAMFNAIPSLCNVASLLFLMYFIFAVMGNQLFAKVALGENMDINANFQQFGSSLLTVMRMSTGEFWNGIMYDVVAQSDGCVESPKYDSTVCAFNGHAYGCTPINGCGTDMGFVYMIFFTWIVMFVFINLFIAVILDGFERSKADEEETGQFGLSEDEFDDFCALWVKYDSEMDWFVSQEEMYEILARLRKPMGLGLKKAKKMDDMKKEVAKYAIMKRSSGGQPTQPFHFDDVAEAVARYVVSQRAEQDGLDVSVQPVGAVGKPQQNMRVLV